MPSSLTSPSDGAYSPLSYSPSVPTGDLVPYMQRSAPHDTKAYIALARSSEFSQRSRGHPSISDLPFRGLSPLSRNRSRLSRDTSTPTPKHQTDKPGSSGIKYAADMDMQKDLKKMRFFRFGGVMPLSLSFVNTTSEQDRACSLSTESSPIIAIEPPQPGRGRARKRRPRQSSASAHRRVHWFDSSPRFTETVCTSTREHVRVPDHESVCMYV